MYSWFNNIHQLWNATVWYPTSNLYFPAAFPIYQALQDISQLLETPKLSISIQNEAKSRLKRQFCTESP